MISQKRPTHPGKVMREHFLAPKAMSANQLSQATGIKLSYIERVLSEKAPIHKDMAPKFAKVFGTTAMFWEMLQEKRTKYDSELKKWEAINAKRSEENARREQAEVSSKGREGSKDEPSKLATGFVHFTTSVSS
jgi:addiction module HigA family antidote